MIIFDRPSKKERKDAEDEMVRKIDAANIARYLHYDKLADVLLEDAQKILDKEAEDARKKEEEKKK
jgi:hypothetical protein